MIWWMHQHSMLTDQPFLQMTRMQRPKHFEVFKSSLNVTQLATKLATQRACRTVSWRSCAHLDGALDLSPKNALLHQHSLQSKILLCPPLSGQNESVNLVSKPLSLLTNLLGGFCLLSSN